MLLQEHYAHSEAFEAHWNDESMKIITGECEALGIEVEINGWHGLTLD
jgi:hypothetical protein